jgi:hypothetical protein
MVGAKRNAQLVGTLYPGWIARFYVSRSVPSQVIRALNQLGAEVIFMPGDGYAGLFWRFLAAADPDVEIMISRDADSRLSMRERAAVDAWLRTGKSFHIMRDHPRHQTAILGGMWGVRKPLLSNMNELLKGWRRNHYWQADQEFLGHTVYEIARNDCVVHDEFFDHKPFPTKRAGYEFVGESVNEKDERYPKALQQLHEYLGRRALKQIGRRTRPRRKRSSLFLRPSLGLGDHIICFGLVHELLKTYSDVVIPVKHHNVRAVSFLFRDCPGVQIAEVRGDDEADALMDRYRDSRTHHVLGLGLSGEDFQPWIFPESFYRQAGMNYAAVRFSHPIPRDRALEARIEATLLPEDGSPFIFVHEDRSRGFSIDRAKLPGRIARVFPKKKDSIFGYCGVIEKAAEVHCIDSSFAHLAETLLHKKHGTKLVIHRYARRERESLHPSVPPWTVIA